MMSARSSHPRHTGDNVEIRLRSNSFASIRVHSWSKTLEFAGPIRSASLAQCNELTTLTGVPIFYECQRCTACCRWPGQVRVTDAEIARLAAFKGMSEHDFVQRFTRLRADRRGLILEEKPDGSCIFLNGNDCSVQPVKPQQCRDFPNVWNFPGFEKTCQATPHLLRDEEYRRRVSAVRTGPMDNETSPVPYGY